MSWPVSIASFALPVLLLVATLVVNRTAAADAVMLRVTDRYSGALLAGVTVTAGDQTLTSNDQGEVPLKVNGEAVAISVAHDGYEPVTANLDRAAGTRQVVALRPTTLQGKVTDVQTGAGIAGARLSILTDAGQGPSGTSGADGSYAFTDVPDGARLHVETDDYGAVEQPIAGHTQLDVQLTRSVATGTVHDEAGAPIAGARVTALNGSATTVTGADGTYRLSGVASGGEVLVRAPGFADAKLAIPASFQVDAVLKPEAIKAVYANFSTIADPERFNRLIEIADRTEINAIVVDVKQDTIYYQTKVPFFQDVPNMITPVFDPAELLRTLDEHGIYAIARMVVFKDPVVAEARHDLAVKDENTGDLWRDQNGAAWVNAFDEELWHANADFAVELANLGFDEVQYDYIRFPSDGDLRTADFGRDYTEEARRAAITGAVSLAADELRPTGVKFAIDLFPIIALMGNDQGIGQTLQDLEPLADYVCLMIYPSHFERGNIPVDGHPNDFPGETVTYTLDKAESLVPGSSRKMRPWLQDFTYPMPGYSPYGPPQVRAQIDAAEAHGVSGWMLWNAAGEFDADALRPAS